MGLNVNKVCTQRANMLTFGLGIEYFHIFFHQDQRLLEIYSKMSEMGMNKVCTQSFTLIKYQINKTVLYILFDFITIFLIRL